MVCRPGFPHSTLDPGFEVANLNLVRFDPVRDGYSVEEAAALFAGLPDELSRVEGVRSVALAGSVPFASLSADQPNTRVSAPTRDGRGGQALHAVFREAIGANYFATLGAPLLSGREFDRRDRQPDTPGPEGAPAIPAILNQSAARGLFGIEDPIGRRIREGELNYTVVGLTRDVQSGFLMPKPVATVFVPMTDEWLRRHLAQRATLLVRATAGPNALAAVRERLASLHPGITVFNVRTMQADLDRLNAFIEWDSAIYVTLAFSPCCLPRWPGGVTAYAVTRRRKEIRIRMALGAAAHRYGRWC